MVVGVLSVSLLIMESNSLKDKRQVVKSIVDHVRNKFNASAAELGQLDSWRRAELGFACISNDQKVVNTLLNRILEYVESDPRAEVDGTQLEFL